MIPGMGDISGGQGGIAFDGGTAESGNGDFGANFGSTFNFSQPPMKIGSTSVPSWVLVAAVAGVAYFLYKKI